MRNFNENAGHPMHRFFAGRGRFGLHGLGGRHGRGFGGRGEGDQEDRLGRILGHGDLRYVILSFLKDKPCHGYELIKRLEEKSEGQYSPSPGVIYPTLTFLQEGGYATSTTEESKNLYHITAEGVKLLEENRDQVQAILERLERVGKKMKKLKDWFGQDDEQRAEHKESRHYLRGIVQQLKVELFSRMPISKEDQQKIGKILENTVLEIRKLK